MGLHKKHVPGRRLTWALAVEEALCFGWIDSQSQRIDDDAVRQRWTPRKPSSNWSDVNIASSRAGGQEGRMHSRWARRLRAPHAGPQGIYCLRAGAEPGLAPEYERRLRADPAACAFFDAATPSYRRVCANWVMTAKQAATREKRLAQLIDDSAHGRLVPPLRYGTPPAWLARAARAAAEAS